MPQFQYESASFRETDSSAAATDGTAARVAERLASKGLHAALGELNATVDYRFTGVYRYDGDWVVSVSLYDRQNSALPLGANVKMLESYCRIAGEHDSSFEISDAPHDPRLDGHAARHAVQSYVVVLLRDGNGTPWGTLCHFDFVPRSPSAAVLADLEAVRPIIEQHFTGNGGLSRWVRPAEPGPGSPPRERA